jgi:hypothetical protein
VAGAVCCGRSVKHSSLQVEVAGDVVARRRPCEHRTAVVPCNPVSAASRRAPGQAVVGDARIPPSFTVTVTWPPSVGSAEQESAGERARPRGQSVRKEIRHWRCRRRLILTYRFPYDADHRRPRPWSVADREREGLARRQSSACAWRPSLDAPVREVLSDGPHCVAPTKIADSSGYSKQRAGRDPA